MLATSGRARLTYGITGADGGADVLLIHAGVNDRHSWRHVIERLNPPHRCVAYDMRGFGETTYPVLLIVGRLLGKVQEVRARA
jgi:pimeloyl-ACP methyl ester carboxylesterase